MAYEDVDWCLRAWQAGLSRALLPDRPARPPRVGHARHRPGRARARLPARLLGALVGFLRRPLGLRERQRVPRDAREVASRDGGAEGRLRIVYVTEDTGRRRRAPRRLRAPQPAAPTAATTSRCTRSASRPTGSSCALPVHSFADYDALVAALAPLDAIKVATWWMTALPVCRASVARGIPVYFVQDIETSYYPDHEHARHAVLDSYRPEFRYMTISAWNRERLRELGLDAELIPPGIDLDTFRPRADIARREDMVLALGRSNPLKNLPLTLDAWRALAEPRPELCLFGIEPELATDPGMRYVRAPSDARGQRAVLSGDRVRADLHARGLRAAAAGGDGDRRRRRLHRRARQPRLLRRRRQLPDARRRRALGGRGADTAAGRSRAARPARGRPASRRPRTTPGSGASMRWRGSSRASPARAAWLGVGRRYSQSSPLARSFSPGCAASFCSSAATILPMSLRVRGRPPGIKIMP